MPNSPDAQPVYKSNSESLVNAAKALYDLGFNVIPVGEGKQPVKGFRWAGPIDTGRRLGFDELIRWFSGATAVAVSGGFLEGGEGVDYVPIIFDIDDVKEGAKILEQVFGDDWKTRLCGQSWSFCGLTGPRPKHRVLCDCKGPGEDCECSIFDRDVEGLGIEEAVKQGAKEVDRKHLSELERGMYIIARVPKACAPGAGVVKLGGGAIEIRFRGYELVLGRHPSGAWYQPVRWVGDVFRPIGISDVGTGEPITCNEWAKLTSLIKPPEPEVKPEVKGEAAAGVQIQLPEAKRHLKPERLKQLVELLKPLWPLRKSGGEHIHDILLYGLVSLMRYRGIAYEYARRLVEEIVKYGISIGEDSERQLQEHLRETVDYIYRDPDAKPWGFKAFKENLVKYGGVSALVNGGVIKSAEEFDAWFNEFRKSIRKILGIAAKEVTLDPGLMEARGRGELPRPERKLSEDGKRTLEELLLKMWGLKMKGRFMHNVIAYGIASLLRRAGIAYEDARAVIEDVVRLAVEEGIDTEDDAVKHLDYVEHVYNNPIAYIWGVRTFVEAGESIIRKLYAAEIRRRVGDVDGDEKAAKKRLREMERELGKEMQADVERWRGKVLKFIGSALAAIHGLKLNVGVSLTEAALTKKQLARVVMAVMDAALERFPYIRNFTMPGVGGGEVDLGLHCWDGKHYMECEDQVESYVEYMYEAVGLEDSELKFTSIAKEVIEVLRNKTRTPAKYEYLVIAFDNCVFDWRTLKCEEHNPERLVFHYIPHPIDVDLLSEALAKGELTEGFVKDHIPKTFEAFRQWVGDKWIKLLEIVGYMLYPNPEKSKAFLFVDADISGPGNSGKSTYINLLKLMLGGENYSAVSLQQLTNTERPFQAADIHRKLANLYPDLPQEVVKDPGAFKVLTGGDTITLERKYGQPFKWTPYTKHIFSANTTPELPLQKIDEAWLDRWDIVEFIGHFGNGNEIKNFHLMLKDEIPKLIALGIAAYNNVRKRGYFTYQYTPEEVFMAWVARYDTIYAFMKWAMDNGVLVKDPAARVEVRELYKYYVRFVAAIWNKRRELRERKKPVGQNIFTMKLSSMGYTIERPRNISTLIGYWLRTEQAEKLLPKEIEESAIEADWLTGEDQAEENEEDSQGETTN
jgi:phage/plasmid-associated DNA primase